MLICQIFLFAESLNVNAKIFSVNQDLKYQNFAYLILLYLMMSLVCRPQLCSKAEYYSYQLTMAVQVWLITYAIVGEIGTD